MKNGFLFFILLLCSSLMAQVSVSPFRKETFLLAARELMTFHHYCGLVTVDSLGNPHTRTINPFPPDSSMHVWFVTHRKSRKVQEIQKNPNVCLYYGIHDTLVGYCTINGKARIVDDPKLLKARKREYWEGIPDWENVMVLVEIVPQRIELIHYKSGFLNAPDTWQAPFLLWDSDEEKAH